MQLPSAIFVSLLPLLILLVHPLSSESSAKPNLFGLIYPHSELVNLIVSYSDKLRKIVQAQLRVIDDQRLLTDDLLLAAMKNYCTDEDVAKIVADAQTILVDQQAKHIELLDQLCVDFLSRLDEMYKQAKLIAGRVPLARCTVQMTEHRMREMWKKACVELRAISTDALEQQMEAWSRTMDAVREAREATQADTDKCRCTADVDRLVLLFEFENSRAMQQRDQDVEDLLNRWIAKMHEAYEMYPGLTGLVVGGMTCAANAVGSVF